MSNRFEANMARRMVDVLVQRGYQAIAVKPDTSLHGGCTDPDHCPQHDGFTVNGEPMLSIWFGKHERDFDRDVKRMSNRALSRLRMELLEADAELAAIAHDAMQEGA